MTTAVVIGGGISGLSAAFYLKKSSKYAKILVLEGSSRLGGWVNSKSTSEGSIFEQGPRNIRAVPSAAGLNTLSLVEDLGLTDDILSVTRQHVVAKNRYIYANGNVNSLPNKFSSLFRKNPPFRKSFASYGMKDFFQTNGSKEDESIYDFINRRFGSDLAEFAIDPLCRGIYAGDCRNLSIKSCFPFLYDAERRYGSVLRGIPLNSFLNKKEAVPLCKLAERAKEEKWSVFSFKSGVQQLPDALQRDILEKGGVEIVTDTPCLALEHNNNGETFVKIEGELIKVDHIVSSIFAKTLAKLLSPQFESLSSELSKIPAITTVVVCVEMDGNCGPARLGFGHLLPSTVDSKVLGVTYDSLSFPEHNRKDRPSFRYTVMMGGAWMSDLRGAIPSLSETELADMALSALRSQLGVQGDPLRVEVSILEDCIPQYVLGHGLVLRNVFRMVKESGLPLSLVGSSYKGPSVNDCIYNAKVEVERVTGTKL